MGLRIVEFDPNDHLISGVLTSGIGDILESEKDISAAISLVLQWKEKSHVYAYIDGKQGKAIRASLDVDHEERIATQLFFIFENEVSLSKGNTLFAKISAFESCFEMEVSIIDHWKEGNLYVACTEIPTKLNRLKTRSSSRNSQNAKKKATISIDDHQVDCSIDSISFNSLVVNMKLQLGQQSKITLGGTVFHCSCIRPLENSSVLKIHFQSDEENGRFMAEYLSNQMPTLETRSKQDLEAVFAAFIKSGFFGNFSPDSDPNERKSLVLSTWKEMETVEHRYNYDMCLVKRGQPVGASSLTMGLLDGDLEHWIFHQLCSIKEETNIEETGSLYTWRAEYLLGRKSNINSVVWFRSQSRWIERIYVKMSILSKQKGTVVASNVFDYMHTRSERQRPKAGKILTYGSTPRAFVKINETLAAGGPDYLHANRNMNMVISRDGDLDSIIEACDTICDLLDVSTLHFRLDTADRSVIDKLPNIKEQSGSDRRAEIVKDGLRDLISCVQHSVAVTEKKNKVG